MLRRIRQFFYLAQGSWREARGGPETSPHCRQEAARLRALAIQASTPEQREALRRIASAYQQLAVAIERGARKSARKS